MTIENLHKALGILMAAGVKGYALAAEHDIIYLGSDSAEKCPPDSDDGKTLDDLGCHISSESGGWAAFV